MVGGFSYDGGVGCRCRGSKKTHGMGEGVPPCLSIMGNLDLFSFIMLWTVAFVPCQGYVKDKILNHVPAFLPTNLFLFCFLSQCSDLPFQNFIFYYIVMLISGTYSELCQTSKMEFFAKNI